MCAGGHGRNTSFTRAAAPARGPARSGPQPVEDPVGLLEALGVAHRRRQPRGRPQRGRDVEEEGRPPPWPTARPCDGRPGWRSGRGRRGRRARPGRSPRWAPRRGRPPAARRPGRSGPATPARPPASATSPSRSRVSAGVSSPSQPIPNTAPSTGRPPAAIRLAAASMTRVAQRAAQARARRRGPARRRRRPAPPAGRSPARPSPPRARRPPRPGPARGRPAPSPRRGSATCATRRTGCRRSRTQVWGQAASTGPDSSTRAVDLGGGAGAGPRVDRPALPRHPAHHRGGAVSRRQDSATARAPTTSPPPPTPITRGRAAAASSCVGVGHQCSVPGAPLNGPCTSPVIQPP